MWPVLAPLQSSLFSSPAVEWPESGGQTLSQASSCGNREREKLLYGHKFVLFWCESLWSSTLKLYTKVAKKGELSNYNGNFSYSHKKPVFKSGLEVVFKSR